MENRPNSRPDFSVDAGPEAPDSELLEVLVMNRAMNVWEGPRYSVITPILRVRSYITWPQDINPTPEALSRAGFFYTGKTYLHFSSTYIR